MSGDYRDFPFLCARIKGITLGAAPRQLGLRSAPDSAPEPALDAPRGRLFHQQRERAAVWLRSWPCASGPRRRRLPAVYRQNWLLLVPISAVPWARSMDPEPLISVLSAGPPSYPLRLRRDSARATAAVPTAHRPPPKAASCRRTRACPQHLAALKREAFCSWRPRAGHC
ncbi:Hypothetical predicted protein [Marmota monax]|uniref:Uncharacterized protein n=1 Tax=Marmota monax TaxID=9995 RepID=A0A5E4B6F0_MARMO|nr:Hypothetical predicted protein [Marmota monax]